MQVVGIAQRAGHCTHGLKRPTFMWSIPPGRIPPWYSPTNAVFRGRVATQNWWRPSGAGQAMHKGVEVLELGEPSQGLPLGRITGV